MRNYFTAGERGILEQIFRNINESRVFLLSTHTTPDGDSLACELALSFLLEKLGKSFTIVNADPVPEIYRFLPQVQRIKVWSSEVHYTGAEVFFVLDCGNLQRLGPVASMVKKSAVVINIDHHLHNSNFGTINWVNSTYAACAEMLFPILKNFGPLGKEEATCLYTGLMTDTGSFLYHLGPWSFSIAEQLVAYGACPEEIGQKVYFDRSLGSLLLLGQTLLSIKFDPGSGAAWAVVTRKMYENTGTKEEDTEKFVDYLRVIREARMVFLLKERDDGVKVSLRSRGNFDVEEIARRFGGGGHRAAAGCFLQGANINQAEKKVLTVINRLQKNREK